MDVALSEEHTDIWLMGMYAHGVSKNITACTVPSVMRAAIWASPPNGPLAKHVTCKPKAAISEPVVPVPTNSNFENQSLWAPTKFTRHSFFPSWAIKAIVDMVMASRISCLLGLWVQTNVCGVDMCPYWHTYCNSLEYPCGYLTFEWMNGGDEASYLYKAFLSRIFCHS